MCYMRYLYWKGDLIMTYNIRMNNKELQSIFEKTGFKTISMKESLEGVESVEFPEEVLNGERKVSFSTRKEEDTCVIKET